MGPGGAHGGPAGSRASRSWVARAGEVISPVVFVLLAVHCGTVCLCVLALVARLMEWTPRLGSEGCSFGNADLSASVAYSIHIATGLLFVLHVAVAACIAD